MAILSRRYHAAVFAICLAMLAPVNGVESQSARATEYEIKAVFLFHFTQFVEWPQTALPDPQAPFVIGVVGEDPFGSFLDETVRNERTDGHDLVIRRFRNAGDIGSCQVLFISRSEAPRLESILGALKGKGVLTVGDFEDFALRGGMIRFLTISGKVHLRVNVDAAKDERLTISSKLLRSADIVHRGKG